MSVSYNKVKHIILSDIKILFHWFTALKSIGQFTGCDSAYQTTVEVILRPKEDEMVLYQFQKIMTRTLLYDKNRILGGTGNSFTCLQNPVTGSKEKVADKQVLIRFHPSKELYRELNRKPRENQ